MKPPAISLTRDVAHPARRHYVLKLDRDADPARGIVRGRIENLATGRHFEFADIVSLLDGLAGDLAAGEPPHPSH